MRFRYGAALLQRLIGSIVDRSGASLQSLTVSTGITMIQMPEHVTAT